MTSDLALFDDEPLRTAPAIAEDLTDGERRRRRQAALIATGYHPLAAVVTHLRLHPDAPQLLEDDGQKRGPLRCGSCLFRVSVGGHAQSFPKCMRDRTETPIPKAQQRKYGPTVRISTPYATKGPATDVRAWWPACEGYEPRSTP